MACRKLIGIAKDSCKSNIGGLFTTVWATNRSNLTITKEVNASTGDETGYVELAWKTGFTEADMVSYAFRKQSSALTSEGTVNDATGTAMFTNNLSLVFARQDVAKRMAIQALALQEDLAVIVKDANGEIYFMGIEDSVTATAIGAETGTAATDANQYTITLTDLTAELPYYVKQSTLDTLLGNQ